MHTLASTTSIHAQNSYQTVICLVSQRCLLSCGYKLWIQAQPYAAVEAQPYPSFLHMPETKAHMCLFLIQSQF